MSRIISQQRPAWLVWLAGLALMGLTLHLGMWQRGRALEKERAGAQARAQAERPALTAVPSSMSQEHAHRRVQLTGHWKAEWTVYLENRPMNGRTGFLVLTPLALSGDVGWVWVQRGWLPRDLQDRLQLPPHVLATGDAMVRGTLHSHVPRIMSLSRESSPGAVQQNLPDLSADQRLGQQASNWIVREQAHGAALVDEDGLSRQWPPFTDGSEKHWGYAFQWWALAALTGALLLWFRILKPMLRARAVGQTNIEGQ